MLRVLGTFKRSVYAQNFSNEISDLGSWVSEIHNGMYPHQVRNLSSIDPNTRFILLTDGCSNQMVCLKTMQMGPITATAILMTHRVPHFSLQRSTISHSLQATKHSFPKQNVHAQPSSPQMGPPPHPPLLPHLLIPHRHQHHPHSRIHHISQPKAGSLQLSILSTSAPRGHKVLRARRSC